MGLKAGLEAAAKRKHSCPAAAGNRTPVAQGHSLVTNYTDGY